MRSMIRLLFAMVVASVACGDTSPSEPAPSPGERSLVVRSPRGRDGAALIEMGASNVRAVVSDSASVFQRSAGDRLHVVLVRAQPGVLRMRVTVADTARPLDAVLLQVADSSNALPVSLGGYSIEVER